MRWLSLDPSTSSFGVAEWEGGRLVTAYALRPPAKEAGLRQRSHWLWRRLREMLPGVRLVASEDFLPTQRQVYAARAAGAIHTVVHIACEEAGVGLRLYTPAEVKRHLTGRANAAKPEVHAAVRARLPQVGGLENEDALDAAAVGLVWLDLEGRRDR